MSETKTVKIRVNADFSPLAKKGDVIEFPVSRTGKLRNHPLAKFFRRRLVDAETDNCVEIVEDESTKKSSKKSTKVTPETDQGVTTDAK